MRTEKKRRERKKKERREKKKKQRHTKGERAWPRSHGVASWQWHVVVLAVVVVSQAAPRGRDAPHTSRGLSARAASSSSAPTPAAAASSSSIADADDDADINASAAFCLAFAHQRPPPCSSWLGQDRLRGLPPAQSQGMNNDDICRSLYFLSFILNLLILPSTLSIPFPFPPLSNSSSVSA